MSAPERIWIDGAVNANVWAEQKTDCTLSGVAAYEYVRADLCAPMQDERVKALVLAVRELRECAVILAEPKQLHAVDAALRDMRVEKWG